MSTDAIDVETIFRNADEPDQFEMRGTHTNATAKSAATPTPPPVPSAAKENSRVFSAPEHTSSGTNSGMEFTSPRARATSDIGTISPPPPEPAVLPTLNAADVERIVRDQAQQMIEAAVWKVLPELAQQIIEREIEKLLKEKDASLHR
jgi:hypothetical protein